MVSTQKKESLILEVFPDNQYRISPIFGAFAFTNNLFKYLKLNSKNTFDVIIDKEKYYQIEKLVKKDKKLYEFIASFNSNLYELVKIDTTIESEFANLRLKRKDNSVDVQQYKSLNKDLMILSDEEALSHFRKYAKKEKREYCFYEKVFYRLLYGILENEHFEGELFLFGNDYAGRNESHKNILEIVEKENKVNKSFKSFKNEINAPLLLSFHAYYADEIDYYIPIIEEAHRLGYQVHISLPLENNNFFKLTDLLRFNPFVSYVENIGRDIIGHYAAVKTFNYQNYFNLEALLILHTKKSIHVNEKYRKYWIKSLTGWMLEKKENQTLLEIYTNKIIQNEVSQVGGAACRCVGLDSLPTSFFSNYSGCENWPYVSGTMSLVSGDVVRNTLMKYTYDDFLNNPIDSHQSNMIGGLPHVIERQLSFEALSQKGIIWL